MKTRPTSVTVISWILIVLGALSLLVTSFTIGRPEVQEAMSMTPIPIPVQMAMTFGGLIMMIVSGVAMLKGQNWGRMLYTIWSLVGLIVGFATSPFKAAMIPGTVVFAIIVFFLFRPNVSAYFSSAKQDENERP